MHLDDETFIARFRNCELAPKDFGHRAHLLMAWLYLQRYSVADACVRMCADTRALAAAWGAAGKYNHTVTEGLMRIMAVRMARDSTERFDDFLAANPDLLSDARSLLARYFSDARLHSGDAKNGWLEPDLATID